MERGLREGDGRVREEWRRSERESNGERIDRVVRERNGDGGVRQSNGDGAREGDGVVGERNGEGGARKRYRCWVKCSRW
jgi:hypothetical protein